MKLVSGADKLPCNLSAPKKTARQVHKGLQCTLCGGKGLYDIHSKNDIRYYHFCDQCHLIFVNPSFHLAKEAEIKRYSEHNNGIDQLGHVAFLNKVIEPALSYIRPGDVGLDYGCGPVPTLSKLIGKNGFKCYDFDPLFNFDHPRESYDFIFSTECLEHFYSPKIDFEKILRLLKPQGHLFLMTERWENLDKFESWYYKRDPTHVSFYHKNTFEFIKSRYKMSELYSDRNRIMILKKN